jgi:hypothetical protein
MVAAGEDTELDSRSQKLDGPRVGQFEPQPDEHTHRWRQLEFQQAFDAAELRVGDGDVEACSACQRVLQRLKRPPVERPDRRYVRGC